MPTTVRVVLIAEGKVRPVSPLFQSRNVRVTAIAAEDLVTLTCRNSTARAGPMPAHLPHGHRWTEEGKDEFMWAIEAVPKVAVFDLLAISRYAWSVALGDRGFEPTAASQKSIPLQDWNRGRRRSLFSGEQQVAASRGCSAYCAWVRNCGGGTRWRRWVLLGVGLVLVVGAFGAFTFLGVGRSSYELCAADSVVALESASRVWLPVVGFSYTYATSHDVREMRVVFDGVVSVSCVLG
jgi:hypothetical protein